jgi:hypothetical protein
MGDRDMYGRLVNRDLIWETDLRGDFVEEEFKVFNESLLAHVLNHKSLKVTEDGLSGKVERTAYQGSQSILVDTGSWIRQLIGLLGAKTDDYLARLPREPDHPFLRMIDDNTKLRFGRMWGLVVRDETRASRHHHSDAFLSAIYYPGVPEVMQGVDGPHAGWLEVGSSNLAIEMADEDVFYLEPKIGKLVIFPSYFFHAVLPTHNSLPRVSIASDLMLI